MVIVQILGLNWFDGEKKFNSTYVWCEAYESLRKTDRYFLEYAGGAVDLHIRVSILRKSGYIGRTKYL